MKQEKLKTPMDKINENKRLLSILIVFLLIGTTLLFADSTAGAGDTATKKINSIFYTIYNFITGWYVKVIALAGIVAIGVKMITSKGEEKLIKALTPWLIAAIIIGSASTICSLFGVAFDTVPTGTNLLDKI